MRKRSDRYEEKERMRKPEMLFQAKEYGSRKSLD